MPIETTGWSTSNPNTTDWSNPSGWTRIIYGSHPLLNGTIRYGGTYTPPGPFPPSSTKWTNPM